VATGLAEVLALVLAVTDAALVAVAVGVLLRALVCEAVAVYAVPVMLLVAVWEAVLAALPVRKPVVLLDPEAAADADGPPVKVAAEVCV